MLKKFMSPVLALMLAFGAVMSATTVPAEAGRGGRVAAGVAAGIIGLGVMGENLALNISRNGYSVAGFDLDAAKVRSFADRTAGANAVAAATLPEFIASLGVPRVILIMVPAGSLPALQ